MGPSHAVAGNFQIFREEKVSVTNAGTKRWEKSKEKNVGFLPPHTDISINLERCLKGDPVHSVARRDGISETVTVLECSRHMVTLPTHLDGMHMTLPFLAFFWLESQGTKSLKVP